MADVEETLVDLTIEEEKEEVALQLDSKGSEGGVSYENCFVVDADRIAAGVIGVSTLTFLLCIGSKADLVENNVIQNNTGWASSVGLHSRASAGPIGGLIQSHTTRLQHVDWDNDMCNVGDDRLILYMDGLNRHQALLSGAARHHETLKLEHLGLGESSDCASPSTCA
ncbi:hypothetical protein Gorai_023065 [Gossypium raimondii]|uniref:Uncharacterized protein n=1 Tax=Gossypium raimondii TaxID=29730 RepID=A0A7J8NVL1_GOSRA|nr:hypothetical protein [Gossypium raimondii]